MLKKCTTVIDWKKHRNDINGTWKVLISVIKINLNRSPFPYNFVTENKTYQNKKDIVKGFNEFFGNILPNLAKNINTSINKG